MKTIPASKVILTATILGALFAGCERRDNTTTGANQTSDTPATAAVTTPSATEPAPADNAAPPTAGAPQPDPAQIATPPAAVASTNPSDGTPSAEAAPATTASADDKSAPAESSGASTQQGSSATGSAESRDMTAQNLGNKAGDAVTNAANAVDDTVITGKVKAALLADDKVKGLDINVETQANEVLLSGYVEDQSQIESAVKIAQNIDGVKKVNNKLEVQKQPNQ